MIAQGGTPPLPYDSRVEYIENTTTGAYIDTGIAPTTNTRFILTASGLQDVGGGQIGARIATNNSMFVMMTPNGGGGVRFDYASNIKSVSGYLTNKYTYSMLGDTLSVYIEGSKVATLTSGTISTIHTIHLFGYNNGGTHATPNYSFKIYRCRIFSGDTLLLDLVPVRVGSTGCMYDQESGNLFYNAGSGSFGYGQDI